MDSRWASSGRVKVGIGIDILNDPDHVAGVLARCHGAFDFVEIFDGGNPHLARQALADVPVLEAVPVLYHNPVMNICGEHLATAQFQDAASKSAALIGAAWAVEEMGYNSIDGHAIPYFMPAVLTEEVARRTASHLGILNAAYAIPVLPETPAFEVAFGEIALERFVNIVVELSDTDFVLDLTHILSYHIATGRDMLECCNNMPLGRVREVHIAGGAQTIIDGIGVFRDTHGSQKVPQTVLRLFDSLLPRLSALCAVTVEVDGGDGPFALEDLQDVRRIMGY